MNVALVILHADPTRGGAERYTVDLATALARRGHAVSLVAISFANDLPPNVSRVQLDARAATRVGRYRQFLDAIEAHEAHVATNPYDIVHAMLPVHRCDLYHPHAGIAVAKEQETGLRMLFNRRRKAMADVERGLLSGPRVPVVLSLSEYVKREIRKSYPALPDERLITLFNAVALDHFDPGRPHDRAGVRASRGIDDSDVVALIVAQDFQRKGVPQAIEATRRINAALAPGQPRMKLLVVGAERSPGADGDVIYAGGTTRVVDFYAAADFFVLQTRHDPCSLVVLEALAMGLPVVSTIFNGATELMTDGEHGFVLPDPTDVEALTRAMTALMEPATRHKMSTACLALRPHLSHEAHLDRLVSIYETARRSRQFA